MTFFVLLFDYLTKKVNKIIACLLHRRERIKKEESSAVFIYCSWRGNCASGGDRNLIFSFEERVPEKKENSRMKGPFSTLCSKENFQAIKDTAEAPHNWSLLPPH